MKRWAAWASAVAIASVMPLAAGAAHACSVRGGYKVPTALQLAARSDTIVVATVTGEEVGTGVLDSTVIATPTVLVAGNVLPGPVRLRGAQLADAGGNGLYASDPRELRQPNRGALTGGCVRWIFARDAKLLLFLRRGESGAMEPVRSAFSRDAEDVSGDDALWVRAVREYAGIASAPQTQWPALLRARAAALRASGDRDSLAIAADMHVELTGYREGPND